MKPIVIANWKMNLGVRRSVNMIRSLRTKLRRVKSQDYRLVICPSFVALEEIHRVLNKTKIEMGAQDVFWREKGAYTGEVSAGMLKEIGCKYIIIGHSERRQNLAENDLMINKKVRLCLKENLLPILCVGESLRARIYGSTKRAVLDQLRVDLKGVRLSGSKRLIIAYEPIWAIGSGKTVSTRQAVEVYEYIKQMLAQIFSKQAVNQVQVIYGGGVNSNNVLNFVGRDKLDGVLVGGASLDAGEMYNIVKQVSTV